MRTGMVKYCVDFGEKRGGGRIEMVDGLAVFITGDGGLDALRFELHQDTLVRGEGVGGEATQAWRHI